jgi:hypothetical protein
MGPVAHEILGFIFLPLNALMIKSNFPSFSFLWEGRKAIQHREFKKINDRKGGKEEWLIRKSTSRPCPREAWMR